MKVLGEDELHEYVHKYNLKVPKEAKKLMKGTEFEKIPFNCFINAKNQATVSDEAIDLLEKMLKYDKNERINCKQAMAHTYFDPIREQIAKQDAAAT